MEWQPFMQEGHESAKLPFGMTRGNAGI